MRRIVWTGFVKENANLDLPHSDGIARVHGMANVQAEELVEYVIPGL